MSGSAGGASVMREFLISLGFQVNRSSANEFQSTIASMTQRVESLAVAVAKAAEDILNFTDKMSEGFERLYYSSQRVGSSADAIKAYGYAASQMGSSVQDAAQSIETLAMKIRTNPGYAGLASKLSGGADPRDTVATMQGLATTFKSMREEVAYQYAQQLGISYTLFRTMLSDMGVYTREYQDKLAAFGVSQDRAASSGKAFSNVMRSLRESIELLYTRLAVGFAEKLRPAMERFNAFVTANGAIIGRFLDRFADQIGHAAEILVSFVIRVSQGIRAIIEWFDNLDPATQRLIAGFVALGVAWRVLNTAFWASPIGLVLALAAAIGLLFEDYMTWKQGGKSLIDWAAWEPSIKNAIKAIQDMWHWIDKGVQAVGGWNTVLGALASFVAGSWAADMLLGIGRVAVALAPILAAIALVAGVADIWKRGLTGNIPANEREGLENHNNVPSGEASNSGGSQAKSWFMRTFPGISRGLGLTAAGGEPSGSVSRAVGVNAGQYGAFREGVASIEKSGYGQMGGSSNRFAGRYQMGSDEIRETAKSLGEPVPAQAEFLANPALQERFFEQYTLNHHNELMRLSPEYAAADPARKMQILGYAHNQGVGGAVNWLKTGKSGADAFGTNGTRYADVIAGNQRALGLNPAASAAVPTGDAITPTNNAELANRAANLSAQLTQQTTIIVNGQPDPRATADQVAQRQRDVNAEAARNLNSRAR